MDYEIIRNEDGTIKDIKVNGKPVKRGAMRGIRKAQKTTYWREFKNTGSLRNLFSGVTVELNPLELTVANWCQQWYFGDYSKNPTNTQAPVQAYDDMKYFLMRLNADAYYDLLD